MGSGGASSPLDVTMTRKPRNIKYSIKLIPQQIVHDPAEGGRMPRQNRVTPEGDIIADPARGTLTGNRGRLHRPDGTLGPSRWTTKAWIACTLTFKDRRRTIMAPGSYTELFLLDEATAYAAGHRPCAECRRAAFRAFRDLWSEVHGPSSATEIDASLHTARTRRDRTKVTFAADARLLPDGTMIGLPDGPALLQGNAALPWTPAGYGRPLPRPDGRVDILTPAPLVELFRRGLTAAVHASAGAAPRASIEPQISRG
jgi:hypothetical protein